MHDGNLLSPLGYQRTSDCGYCKDRPVSEKDGRESCMYYAIARSLQPAFYKALIDRGWRRSGSVLYKPDGLASCCPHYTIRLDSHDFRASRSQRQIQNRFNSHVLGEAYLHEAQLVYPRSRQEAARRDTTFDLLERVHEGEREHVRTPPAPAHNFRVVLEHDDYSDTKFALFENYQRNVHHEPPHKISRKGFREFLCNSPLVRCAPMTDECEYCLGSYHQCYYLDDKLVAMGVLDLLPGCVSSVYFMYDESVQKWSFGKLSALREIALAKEASFRWWYAGFYIHDCVKMRYKVEFAPQYVLDPETHAWTLLDAALKARLDENRYVSSSIDVPRRSPSAVHKRLGDDHDPTFSIPGVPSRAEVARSVDLGAVKFLTPRYVATCRDLVAWERGSVEDASSLQGIIAELIAVVGMDLADQVTVTFR